MKYKAVIFDLFGTLVGDIVGPPAMDVRVRMAATLSIPVNDFIQMWAKSYYGRNTGAFRSVEDNIIHICEELGTRPKDKDTKIAAQIRQDLARKIMMKPRKGALKTLLGLKDMGIKTGLISNCDPDAPIIWPDTPFKPLFDAAVFSSSSGCKKPEYHIYKKAIDQLSVAPENCLYVGNGQGSELRGAYEAGVHPVLITPDIKKGFHIMSPAEDEIALAQKEGEVITSLEEVLTLLN